MNESLETAYHHYDEQEEACHRAAERLEAARTPIGRFFASRSLEYHRSQLAEATEEVETGEFQAIKSNK